MTCCYTLVGFWLMFNGSFSSRAIGVWNISRSAKGQDRRIIRQWNNTEKKTEKSQALFSLGFVEIISLTRIGFLGGVFLANHLTSSLLTTWPEQLKTQNIKKLCYKRDDRAELGVVDFHDIRPWNGAGLFFQSRIPHGSHVVKPTSVVIKLTGSSNNNASIHFTKLMSLMSTA